MTNTAPKKKVVRKSSVTENTGSQVLVVTDLESLIPSKELTTGYINRTINGHTDFDVFRQARKHQWNILLEGATGLGKTASVRAYCAEDNIPFYAVTAYAGKTLEQMLGGWKPTATPNKWEWVDGAVTTLVKNGGVLLLNEVNFLHEKIVSGLFSLARERTLELPDHHGEVIIAHPDFQLIADMNPNYSGTRALNPAFRNRFALKLSLDYDTKIEKSLVKSAALIKLANNIRQQTLAGQFDSPTSTNMLMEFEQVYLALGWDFATRNFADSYEDTEREAIFNVFQLNQFAIENELGGANRLENIESIIFDDDWVWTFTDKLEGDA